MSEVEESLLSAIESCRFEIKECENNLALDLSPHADLASSIAFRLAPVLNRKPASIASEIHEALPKEYIFVERAELAGPYLNFFMNSRFIDQVLKQAVADNCWSGKRKEKVIV
ncbi:MAG: arginine--tRNA ligase, partial [Methanotrichaceae archaeon]|nr:arginine--tRNA ligase [Methanotrichaceae archaeon]